MVNTINKLHIILFICLIFFISCSGGSNEDVRNCRVCPEARLEVNNNVAYNLEFSDAFEYVPEDVNINTGHKFLKHNDDLYFVYSVGNELRVVKNFDFNSPIFTIYYQLYYQSNLDVDSKFNGRILDNVFYYYLDSYSLRGYSGEYYRSKGLYSLDLNTMTEKFYRTNLEIYKYFIHNNKLYTSHLGDNRFINNNILIWQQKNLKM